MPELPLDLHPDEFAAWRDAGREVTLVDCREPWEHALVSLPGALLIPLGTLADRADEVPRDKPVVVYCHHGVRSRHGAHLLRMRGVVEARSLAGGIDHWADAYDPALPRY